MFDNARVTNGFKLSERLKRRLANGLALLIDADGLRRRHALPADSPLFLPRIADLYRAGVAPDDLHWLLEKRYVTPLCQNRDTSRGRMATALLGAGDSDIAIGLTDAGIAALGRQSMALNTFVPESGVALDLPRNTAALRYDGAERELWLGQILVMRLRCDAKSMATVLDAFERWCWKQVIRCPFEHLAGPERSQTVRDAVFGLNQRQPTPLIEFHSLAKGQRLVYLIVDDEEPEPPTAAPKLPR